MKEIRNSERLQAWLLESGYLQPLWDRPRFVFDSEEFDREVAGVRAQYPHFQEEEAEARAALRLLGKEEARQRHALAPAPAPAAPAPGEAAHARHPEASGRWARAEKLLLALAILLAAIAMLLAAPRAHGQALIPPLRDGYRSLWLAPAPNPEASGRGAAQYGQPGGIIIQLANGGTVLATRPAGLLQFNCSTNMSCSWSGTTFTLSATGGSGSGCIPPGTTANALLFDAGSGACSDVAKFTWNSGTSTLSLASGGTFDPTAGTMKVPGTNGQLLYNNSGALGAEDPVVSGPDARGAAQSKNPVAGLGGIDYGTACSGGPCVQEAKVDSSGNVYVDVTNTVPVSGTFWQATQPVSLASLPALPTGSNTIGAVTQASGPWSQNVSQWASTALGAPSAYGTSPGAVNVPGVNAYVTNTPAVTQSGGPWTTTDSADGSTGSAIPSKAQYAAGNGSGNLTGYLNCDNTAVYDAATNGATQLVALSSGKTVYVCGFQFSTSQTTAVSVDLVYGTGTNCATSTTKLTPAYPLQAASSSGPAGLAVITPGFTGLKTAASNALCINTSAGQSVQAIVWYTQF